MSGFKKKSLEPSVSDNIVRLHLFDWFINKIVRL